MKFRAGSSELKQYGNRFPEKQVITMLDLARYMELYECAPDVVSKGKQKMLQKFASEIKEEWDKKDDKFNVIYYKRVVSLAIIYRKTDEIVKNTEWYKEKRSYKANVVAYTISLIFNYIRKHHKGFELDFERIWNNQGLYKELEDEISVLSKEIYNFITGPRDTENVTEWCKREACWLKAKEQIWTFNDEFIYTLVEKDELYKDVKQERKNQQLSNEVDALKEILSRGSDYWNKVMIWGQTEKQLSPKEINILKMVININMTGRIPTDKQAKVVIQARERLVKNGMPLQF